MSSGTPLSRAAAAIARSQIGVAARAGSHEKLAESAASASASAGAAAAEIGTFRFAVARGRVAVAGGGMAGCGLLGGGSASLALDDEIAQRLVAAAEAGGDHGAVVLDRGQRARIDDADRHRELAVGEPQLQRHLAEVGGVEGDVKLLDRLRRLGRRRGGRRARRSARGVGSAGDERLGLIGDEGRQTREGHGERGRRQG